MTTHVVIVMGVSGCGKTSVAQALATAKNWRCLDADDFHPPSNVEKMRAGQPLTDEDRWPWLDRLNSLLRHSAAKNESIVLACSALKAVYRERLRDRINERDNKTKFSVVYLNGSFEVIEARMKAREHQYMPSSLLKSQFATLEAPTDCISLPIDIPIQAQIDRVTSALT
jgi:gluconokinase